MTMRRFLSLVSGLAFVLSAQAEEIPARRGMSQHLAQIIGNGINAGYPEGPNVAGAGSPAGGSSGNSYIANAVHFDRYVGVGTAGAVTASNNCRVTLAYTVRLAYQASPIGFENMGGSDLITNSVGTAGGSEAINGVNITSDNNGYRVNIGDNAGHKAQGAVQAFPIPGYTNGNWSTWVVSVDACTLNTEYIQAWVTQPGGAWTQVINSTQSVAGFGSTNPIALADNNGFGINVGTTIAPAVIDASDFYMWPGLSLINAGHTGIDQTAYLSKIADTNGHIYSPASIVTTFGTPAVAWYGPAATWYQNKGSGATTYGMESEVGASISTTTLGITSWNLPPWAVSLPVGAQVLSANVSSASNTTVQSGSAVTYTLSGSFTQTSGTLTTFAIPSGAPPIVDLPSSPSLASAANNYTGNPTHAGGIKWRCSYSGAAVAPTSANGCANVPAAGDLLVYMTYVTWSNGSNGVGSSSCLVPTPASGGATWTSWITGTTGGSSTAKSFVCAAYATANAGDALGTGNYALNLTLSASPTAIRGSFTELIDYGPATVSAAGTWSGSTTTTSTALGVTPATAYDTVLYFLGQYQVGYAPFSCPSGFTKRIDTSFLIPGNPPEVLLCDKQLATAAATGNVTNTMSVALDSSAALLAITPQ